MRPMRKNLSPINLAYRGIPREYFDATIDEYPIDPEIKGIMQRYMENLDQMLEDCVNLIMYGVNGKTYLSSLLVKEAYKYRYSSMRVTLQSFIDLQFKQKEEWAKEKNAEIRTCEFLVIDEIGKETFDGKSFNIATFEELQRHRDTLGLPTIFCTNLPLDGDNGLYAQYGKSIRSLIEGKALKLLFEGEDYRPKVLKNKKGIQILMGE
jgi:DNA replication protein DnaC